MIKNGVRRKGAIISFVISTQARSRPIPQKQRELPVIEQEDPTPKEVPPTFKAIQTDIEGILQEMREDASTDPTIANKRRRNRFSAGAKAFFSVEATSLFQSLSVVPNADDFERQEKERMALEEYSATRNQKKLAKEQEAKDDVLKSIEDVVNSLKPKPKAGKKAAETKDDSEDTEEEEEARCNVDDLEDEELDFLNLQGTHGSKKKLGLIGKQSALDKFQQGDKYEFEDVGVDNTVFIDPLPNDPSSLAKMLEAVNFYSVEQERLFFEEEDSDDERALQMACRGLNPAEHNRRLKKITARCYMSQFWCIPLSEDARNMGLYYELIKAQLKCAGQLFDVITTDPPWQLSTANPTRGVAIAYNQIHDSLIGSIPWGEMQTDGFFLVWVINSKIAFALEMMTKHGYKVVDEIVWVKQTCTGRLAPGHGFYLQHVKETCLVGAKGSALKRKLNFKTDIIFSQRRGQSQKPEEIYDIAESLHPNGYYLEVFGRRNNLHNGWVTIGNEL